MANQTINKKTTSPLVLGFLTTLAIVNLLVPSPYAIAQGDIEDQILPINFLKLGEVALVEEIPDSFYPNRPKQRDGRWRAERWSCLLRRKMHPDLLSNIIKSYEDNGLKTPPDGFSFDDRKYFRAFFSQCFPWKMKKPWDVAKLTEFEQIRAMRKFYEKHAIEIAKYDVELPLMIGAIHEISLKNYDRANQRFEIAKQPSSRFLKGKRFPLRYKFEIAYESLRFLPMKTEEAEKLLTRIPNRKLHLMESHRLIRLEQHPEITSGVVGVLAGQEFNVFVPREYQTPVYSQKTKGLNEIADGQAVKPKNNPINNDQNIDLNRKMAELCKKLKLFNIGGIPISGSIPFTLLNPAQRKEFDASQQRLADRILLSTLPDLLTPEVITRGHRSRRRKKSVLRHLPLLARVLGEETMSRYYDSKKRAWHGSDTFEQQKNMKRFIAEQSQAVKNLAVAAPLRFRTIEQGIVGDYDFEAKRFPVDWMTFRQASGLNLDVGLDFPQSNAFRKYNSINVTSSLRFPKFWSVGPEEGKKLYRSLKVVNRDLRALYSSTIFDATNSLQETPVFTGPKGGAGHPLGLLITPVSSAVYADGLCKTKMWDRPINAPSRSVLQTEKITPRDEVLYLWQPEVQVALLDKRSPLLVKRVDWVAAASSVFVDDLDYYSKGVALSHRVKGLDRANLLNRLSKKRLAEGQKSFWDKDYQPFFPQRFFGRSIARDAGERIRDIQLEILQGWLRQRIENVKGEFRLNGALVIDRKLGMAKLEPGESNQQHSQIVSSLPNQDELGFAARLAVPRDSRPRHFDHGETETDFSVVFPAIKSRLLFAVDVKELPKHKPSNDDERYQGDLVVKIDKVEHVNDSRLGPQALIHVQPLRFEILGLTDRKAPYEDRLAHAGKTTYVLPVEIQKFTMSDLKHESAERKRKAEEAKKQKWRELEAKEEARRKSREKARHKMDRD